MPTLLSEQRRPIRDGGFTPPDTIVRRDSIGMLAPGERRVVLGPLVNGGVYAYTGRYVGAVVSSGGRQPPVSATGYTPIPWSVRGTPPPAARKP
jgi:hypothetical protein